MVRQRQTEPGVLLGSASIIMLSRAFRPFRGARERRGGRERKMEGEKVREGERDGQAGGDRHEIERNGDADRVRGG